MLSRGTVLFPTDFSHYAQHAMRYAIAMAHVYGRRLHVAHVLDPALFSTGSGHGFRLSRAELESMVASLREHAESRLEHVVRTAHDAGVEAEAHVVEGVPSVQIIRLARELDCRLIVTSTHGRTGIDHIVFGSCCEKVIRQAPVPVLCIKHPQHEFVSEPDAPVRLRRVLFPTDFSEFAGVALPYARSLCERFKATLVLLHVVEPPLVLPDLLPDVSGVDSVGEGQAVDRLQRMAEAMPGISVETSVRIGVPYREIVRTATEGAIDLVVMPTHGRTGLAHILFGGVAEKVVRLAPCAAMTVRPECPGNLEPLFAEGTEAPPRPVE